MPILSPVRENIHSFVIDAFDLIFTAVQHIMLQVSCYFHMLSCTVHTIIELLILYIIGEQGIIES